MHKVGIVCDSTCDLEPTWLADHDVVLVPLRVLFGDEAHLDWIELRPAEFFDRLATAKQLPTTSQPSPADFAKAYSHLAEQGCTGVVSIHLTAALSGTFESATLAAKNAPIPIEVVDTKTVSQALGLVIKRAMAARETGATLEDVARTARETSSAMRLFFILDTLDYLVKGGRAGKAQGLAASVLNIKPVLKFNSEGTIEPFKKLKGTRKALTELAAYVAEDARQAGRIRLAILHASDPGLAEELLGALGDAGVDFELDSVGLVGAVIGTYAGPSAVGLAYYPID